MKRIVSRRPSPATIISLVALFVALGGTSYAAIALAPRNSVGSAQVINGSLLKKDLSKKTVAALKGNRGLRGAQGAQGAAGAAGAVGASGPAGAAGAAGAVGPAGATGPAGAPNPNADTLNGFAANGLVRVAKGSGSVVLGTSDTVAGTLTITAPAAGFVMIHADYNTIGTGCPCSGWYLLKDVVAGTTVSNYKITRVEVDSNFQSSSLGWVFPVTAGVRTFQVVGHRNLGTTVSADGVAIQALFVPFGSTGGATLAPDLGPSSPTSTH